MVHAATPREAQIVEAARHVNANDTVVVGSGSAFAVAALAQKTHARRATFVLDSGVVGARFGAAPVSVCDPAIPSADRMGSMSEVFFALLQAGRVDLGILRAAQVDRRGNLNSSYVVGPENRRRRLPGAGGAPAIAAFARRLVVVVPHELRRLPSRCDYVTCPGPGPDRGSRELIVVTDLCTFRADRERPELRVAGVQRGADPDRIRSLTGFGVEFLPDVHTIEAPAAGVIETLRREVDPERIYLGPPATPEVRSGGCAP